MYIVNNAGVNILAQISQFFPDGNEKFTILPGTLFAKDMFGWILCSRILWRISVRIFWEELLSAQAHIFLSSEWWENSKMNFLWCKVVFSHSGKHGWNYFCRFFWDWEFLGRINFAEFSKTVNFRKNCFSRFPWLRNFEKNHYHHKRW